MRRLLLLWKTARRDLRVLWTALSHPDRPGWLIPVLGLVAVYALEPFNIAIPLLGLVDDAVLVPIVLHLIVLGLPVSLRSAAVR
ncbi:hypothetical protein P350_35845 [Burkholderia cepacia JBK9]|uniref:DUF1232 domain-containing protein n=1 Tax=Burkholderia arboris TaxID=488730 RepID=A0A9Q9SN74_9BURK|nr:hypothetical protein [Burkholderia arboris]ALX16993.1 hypothetical protein P350_35845 [Burkholderia cepacia JBK9]MCA8493627.1 hypothetical protein [Burkholderia arboris]UTV59921.1 hypothetical protein NLX30_37695 [Burkholderia arboris]VWC15932.1 hypothetical protein BAR24066_05536 [Burkholderia arboris]